MCHWTWCILTWSTSHFRGSVGVHFGTSLIPYLCEQFPECRKKQPGNDVCKDTKIYKEIKSRDDCASLREDLDSLSAWSADSGLSFNVTKCKVQTITWKRRSISASYQITGCVIKSTASERDLGVSCIQWPDLEQQSLQVSCQCKQAFGIHPKEC